MPDRLTLLFLVYILPSPDSTHFAKIPHMIRDLVSRLGGCHRAWDRATTQRSRGKLRT